MFHTRLCDVLSIEVPIIVAPMGFITGPELAAAVSNAGGFGILSAGLYPPVALRQDIRRLRELTRKPFGVNLLLQFPQEENITVCIEEHIPFLSFFWGDPSPYVERIHAAGIKVIHQVGSVAAAQHSADTGVDVIIAQGFEAGGHVAGTVSLTALVPRVVDAIAPVPVAAAGGIADARGVVAALALGAEAAVLGTRFLATPEAAAHPHYKQKVLEATEEETVHTILFGHGWPHSPHRVLNTAFVQEWIGEEERAQQARPDEPLIGETRIGGQPVPLLRFMGFPPSTDASGDIDSMSLYAGQSVGLTHEIKPAAEIVQELVEGASQIIRGRLTGFLV
jgi:NAD(P)H-dependent flavin oxidoreductase YrpB (nitropropane dioxygenase family)